MQNSQKCQKWRVALFLNIYRSKNIEDCAIKRILHEQLHVKLWLIFFPTSWVQFFTGIRSVQNCLNFYGFVSFKWDCFCIANWIQRPRNSPSPMFKFIELTYAQCNTWPFLLPTILLSPFSLTLPPPPLSLSITSTPPFEATCFLGFSLLKEMLHVKIVVHGDFLRFWVVSSIILIRIKRFEFSNQLPTQICISNF